MGNLKNLPISSLSNNGQPRNLTKQTRSRPINQTNQKVQKHSTVQTHQQIQSQPIFWIKTPLQQIRKYQQHIKHYSLHGIEPHISAKIGVSHNNKVKSQKHQKPI